MKMSTASRWRGALLVAAMTFPSIGFTQDSTQPVRSSVKAGVPSIVQVVPCATGIAPADAASIVPLPSGHGLLVSSTPDQRVERIFTAKIGSKIDGTTCDAPIVDRQYVVTFTAAPEVSGQALQTSFQVLVAAFVLALLLESAFALLFNWRPYAATVVGKSWNSLITFAAALAVVRFFDFDLMAQLFNAYYPQSVPGGNWGTSTLTAMILAGGSAGINRILTTMGFRSPFKDVDPPPTTDPGHAWVAVEVEPARRGDSLVVDITEVTPAPGVVVNTTVGVAGTPRPSLASLFFRGSIYRVPRSAGIQVATSKYYTIVIRDLQSSKDYDVTGREVTAANPATVFKFGARAILDFRVKIA